MIESSNCLKKWKRVPGSVVVGSSEVVVVASVVVVVASVVVVVASVVVVVGLHVSTSSSSSHLKKVKS
jgi:hypothetical protein